MNGVTRSRGDRIFDAINYTFLSIILISVLYPLYYILIASVSDPTYVNNGEMTFWPKGFMLDGYQRVFEYADVWIGYRNTIFYTCFGTILNVAVTLGIGYTLSRKHFWGKGALTAYLLIPMFFTGGLIPTFLIVKGIGIYNTPLAMIILGTINIFNVIITRTFIQGTIPDELYESAQIDGCNHFTFFFRIVLPLSSSIIAVLTLYYGVEHWNDFFKALIYLNDRSLFSLQLVLRGILIQSNVTTELLNEEDMVKLQREVELLKYALIVIASVPILAVYPFVQKYFVKGVMIGSVKG